MNSGSLLLKVDPKLKSEFELACLARDFTATQALRQLMRRYVEEFVEAQCARITLRAVGEDGICTDERTGGMFCSSEPGDLVTMKRTYRLWDEFERRHPEVPLVTYAEREAMKKRGRALLTAPQASLDDRLNGYELVMRAHFTRSAAGALEPSEAFSYLDHPGYAEYASHSVACDLSENRVALDLAEALQRRYPAPAGPVMVKDSYWRKGRPREGRRVAAAAAGITKPPPQKGMISGDQPKTSLLQT